MKVGGGLVYGGSRATALPTVLLRHGRARLRCSYSSATRGNLRHCLAWIFLESATLLFFFFLSLGIEFVVGNCRPCVFHQGGCRYSAAAAFEPVAENAQDKRWVSSSFHISNIKHHQFVGFLSLCCVFGFAYVGLFP